MSKQIMTLFSPPPHHFNLLVTPQIFFIKIYSLKTNSTIIQGVHGERQARKIIPIIKIYLYDYIK